MTYEEIIAGLEALRNPWALAGMARFGIKSENAFGVSMPELRKMARRIGKDRSLAQRLWNAGIRETRILACLVDDPRQVTAEQMDCWASEFDDWETCDQCCMNLFQNTAFAEMKSMQWSSDGREFVKRAGFVLMARLAVSRKHASNELFEGLLHAIPKGADDDRSSVTKAVSWALRQIGKRNRHLNAAAIEIAREIGQGRSKSARWIASDALRELTSEAVHLRLLHRDRPTVQGREPGAQCSSVHSRGSANCGGSVRG